MGAEGSKETKRSDLSFSMLFTVLSFSEGLLSFDLQKLKNRES